MCLDYLGFNELLPHLNEWMTEQINKPIEKIVRKDERFMKYMLVYFGLSTYEIICGDICLSVNSNYIKNCFSIENEREEKAFAEAVKEINSHKPRIEIKYPNKELKHRIIEEKMKQL